MSEQALTPIEQKTVWFYNDEVTAVLVEVAGQKQIYIPVRPLCSHLGIAWSSQRLRINRDPVLSEVVRPVIVTITGVEHGQPQDVTTICLPLEYLNGWLFGVSALRVKPEIKERLVRYQRECYQVLAKAFLLKESAETTTIATLMQVREMGLGIVRMAEEQIEFERRLSTTENRLEQAARVVGDINRRLTAVEKRLSPGQLVTEEQASQISEAVKTVALALGEKTGRSEFGAIYGELYRKFGITSYKQLPAGRFDVAMGFLTSWYEKVLRDGSA